LRATAPQTGMTVAARRKNLRGAFTLGPGAEVKNLRVALVDDVMTTGSTVQAAAQCLRAADAREVEIWVVARAQSLARGQCPETVFGVAREAGRETPAFQCPAIGIARGGDVLRGLERYAQAQPPLAFRGSQGECILVVFHSLGVTPGTLVERGKKSVQLGVGPAFAARAFEQRQCLFIGTVFWAVWWGGWGLVLGPVLVVALRRMVLRPVSKLTQHAVSIAEGDDLTQRIDRHEGSARGVQTGWTTTVSAIVATGVVITIIFALVEFLIPR